MLPGAVIAAQGAEIVVVQRLETGFGIDLGGRKIQVAVGLHSNPGILLFGLIYCT
jgi:hypothetical protein